MTEGDYKTAKASGQVQQDAPAQDAPTSGTDTANDKHSYTLDDFLPVLVPLLTPRRVVTTAPTETPKTFVDAIQLYDDGTTRALYLFVGNTWRSVVLTGDGFAYARAYLLISQSVTTTFNTKVEFDSADFVSGITFESGNHRFVVTAPGKYLVTVALQYSVAPDSQYTIKLYKNGAFISQGGQISGNYSGIATPSLTDIVSLAAGDTLEVYTIQYSGSGATINGGSNATYFAVSQIST